MSWPAIAEMQGLAWSAAGRMLNGVAEGTALAAGTWVLLRLGRRLNASTRFAAWFAVLLVMAALPLFGVLRAGRGAAGSPRVSPVIVLPGWLGASGFFIWAVLAGIALTRVGLGLGELRRLRRDCTAVDLSRLEPILKKTLEKFRRVRAVELCLSERVKVPTAIGFFQPAVILPAWTLHELSADELHSVLIHELAHLRRWDDWTTLAQELLRALFCIHPAVWLIAGRLSLEREMACDDLVLAQTGDPRSYAQCLVSVAEKSFLRRGVALAQAAVSRMRHTSLRVARILNRERPSPARVWKPAVVLMGVLSAACVIALARAPQLVAFRNESPAGPVETAAIAAPTHLAITTEAKRETGPDGLRAAVVPALWKGSPMTQLPAAGPRRHAATTLRHEGKGRLARAENRGPGTGFDFAVDFRPEAVVFMLEPNGSAAFGSEVWRIDVYELTVYPASSAARQPVSAKI
jgi:beta-lactamase regulating signal transducer with metallopeptidase domain